MPALPMAASSSMALAIAVISAAVEESNMHAPDTRDMIAVWASDRLGGSST